MGKKLAIIATKGTLDWAYPPLILSSTAAALGYEGKWAIHPSQIELANSVFSPLAAEVERAKRILTALEEAAVAGKGAASLDGRLIDAASARMAENVVKQDELIQSKSE